MEKHYCINCYNEATMRHHVIPKELGGNDTTNCVWLCDKCHGLLHSIQYTDGKLNHSALIKEGIRKARERGVKVGRKKTDIFDIAPIYFRAYNLYKSGQMRKIDCVELCGCSRPTLDKYFRLIEEANN